MTSDKLLVTNPIMVLVTCHWSLVIITYFLIILHIEEGSDHKQYTKYDQYHHSGNST